ncbi:hypothetical protein [Microcoleus sp. OTE_8_concoct_300]|uniref:hypothetical protein n=1 Tax=Microcoleus sp. OTE_8_concoct_300 TaxID=2964710 RepID=UPI00403FB61D
MNIMDAEREQQVIDEAERIQKEVDKVFELARSNNWSLEQFAVKFLAGATDFDLAYIAIGSQLVQNVTGLDGQSSVEILKYLIAQVIDKNSIKIRQAQELFYRGLLINKHYAEQRFAADKRQEKTLKQTSKKKRN